MMSSDERLAYMAGQILRNFAPEGEGAAIAATVDHLTLYWDPHMKARAAAMLEDPTMDLSQEVRVVFERLGAEARAG